MYGWQIKMLMAIYYDATRKNSYESIKKNNKETKELKIHIELLQYHRLSWNNFTNGDVVHDKNFLG